MHEAVKRRSDDEWKWESRLESMLYDDMRVCECVLVTAVSVRASGVLRERESE